MKKKCLALFIIMVLVQGINYRAFSLYRQRNMQSYIAASIDKEKMLADSRPPRIILVGGSSVAFGFNSEIIKQVTALDTFNMGLQGSLGIRFQLNSIKPFLANGDIVVISPEYNNFTYGFVGGDLLLQDLIVNPGDLRYISSLSEVAGLVKNLLYVHTSAIDTMINVYIKEGCLICESSERIYYRQAFNPYGDITTNQVDYATTQDVLLLDGSKADVNTRRTIQVLNSFSEYAEQNGIQVYLVYPTTSIITDQATLQVVQNMDRQLRANLAIPILGSIEESQYEDYMMFNTVYHLNAGGAAFHTRQFLSWLCAADPSLTCKN